MYGIIIVAAIILAIIVSVKWRASPGDFEGFWRDADGESQIVAHRDGVEIVRAGSSQRGRVKFLRRVCVREGGRERCGSLDLLGRHINWGWGGDKWIREGIYRCGSCVTP